MEQFGYDSEVVKENSRGDFRVAEENLERRKKGRVKPHFQTTKNIPTLGLNIRCK